jgi:hypothetical protein
VRGLAILVGVLTFGVGIALLWNGVWQGVIPLGVGGVLLIFALRYGGTGTGGGAHR